MQKIHKIETKKLKVEAIIFNPSKEDEEEPYDRIEFDFLMPVNELTRLKEEGMFSIYFENVEKGLKRWLEEMTHFEVYISFIEVKNGRIESWKSSKFR